MKATVHLSAGHKVGKAGHHAAVGHEVSEVSQGVAVGHTVEELRQLVTKRFSRVARAEHQVACPRAVCVYNAHMGGVDLLHSLIALYRTHIRSK